MSTERSKDYYAARRKAAEWVDSWHKARHTDESFKLVCLERAIEAQRYAARIEAEFIDSLPPCKMCGRKVTSPCNDAEGYYEAGPWDGACDSYAKGNRQQ